MSAITLDSSPPRGTAFPTSGLYVGMEFVRTDLLLRCMYDGTRWLGPPQELIYTLRTPANAGGLAPVVATLGDAPIAQDRGLHLDRISFSGYVIAPNDGAHYWTFTFFVDNGAGTRTNLGSANTSGVSPAFWKPLSLTSFSANNWAAGTQVALSVDTSTTGPPGNLYPAFAIRYMEIIT